ncbi:hypothetical protein CMQ_2567 [Grosmannia clavigera kw1407]|uniref:Uncharacterized protein n=1 Tax=Grosmannia clavigera (strain kw1407 / UAMH 11150) TaxID=655863 RepID=F0XHQ5_GROCL|nr:uncharacterized protein CMQ_2567 [Grosmannia clavigera kw1407]EFX02638.1 hypothetical protein CMQ_2567 [Grosmannia clavigera kw1407]
MRSNTLFISLLVSAVAAPVLAVPVSVVLDQNVGDAVPAPPRKAVSQHTQPLAADIDNRPYTPSPKVSPAVVLATPRPLITSYLMGLAPPMPAPAPVTSKSQPSTARKQNKTDHPDKAKRPKTGGLVVVQEALDEAEAVIAAVYSESMERNLKNANKASVPCYTQLRHAHDEMMVISMVAVFLLVIMVIEFLDNNRQKSMDIEAAPALGAIRLEDGKYSQTSERQPLSVQAAPPQLDLATPICDEKTKTN